MLEETARDRVDADGVANAGDTGLEAAESRAAQRCAHPDSCLNRRMRSWSTAGSRVSGTRPSRLVVVVAGADVAVAAQAALLPTHDEWHGGAAHRGISTK